MRFGLTLYVQFLALLPELKEITPKSQYHSPRRSPISPE